MSDDLIKRSDAIKAVSKVDDYGDGIGFEVRSHCLVELELVPSAGRPQGEWILECDAEGEDDNLYRCSECGCNYGCQEYDTPNYCPNCGARMLKGAEAEG